MTWTFFVVFGVFLLVLLGLVLFSRAIRDARKRRWFLFLTLSFSVLMLFVFNSGFFTK
jgi:hypothetical protein